MKYRSSPAARRARLNQFATVAVFAVAGVLFVTSANTASGRQLRSDSDLPGLVQREQARVAERTEAVGRLRTEVDALSAAQDDPRARALQDDAEALVPAARTAAVTGEGVVVSLDDAPRSTTSSAGVDPDLLIVHQQDLQAVVNTLWASGATNIALMDQQIISTSAVRCVGNTLRLQGQVYAPPYVVTAIGDPEALVAGLDAAPEVQAYRDYEAFGLGWELQRGTALTVPEWSGPLDLRHADVLDT